MKPILCLLGIHKHEPIKRIKKYTRYGFERKPANWKGCEVPTCVRCGHKLPAKILTEPMSRAKAEGWKKIHSNL